MFSGGIVRFISPAEAALPDGKNCRKFCKAKKFVENFNNFKRSINHVIKAKM